MSARRAGICAALLAVGALEARAQARDPLPATSTITEASPFVVRSGFTLAQVATPMADWSSKNNLKKVVTLVIQGRSVTLGRQPAIQLASLIFTTFGIESD